MNMASGLRVNEGPRSNMSRMRGMESRRRLFLDEISRKFLGDPVPGEEEVVFVLNKGNMTALHVLRSWCDSPINWTGVATYVDARRIIRLANTPETLLTLVQPHGQSKESGPCASPLRKRIPTFSTVTRRQRNWESGRQRGSRNFENYQ
ncbi:uncharacterized protein LOC112494610 [Cephus cinctus]|uniref:Uncharacterized protein LOC112494610 n=1 Tax=Cephus cinctus TaxID=211228 RepID=A0AAJ7W2X3_CEPCN|nr:uncharacterized protein LOC112494610 [Cephus cinctus]